MPSIFRHAECLFFTFPVLLCSCSEFTQKIRQLQSEEGNWEISSRSASRNTYTVNGLLDTTFVVSYMYIKGQLSDSGESMEIQK